MSDAKSRARSFRILFVVLATGRLFGSSSGSVLPNGITRSLHVALELRRPPQHPDCDVWTDAQLAQGRRTLIRSLLGPVVPPIDLDLRTAVIDSKLRHFNGGRAPLGHRCLVGPAGRLTKTKKYGHMTKSHGQR
jgi:hypothetical protein